MHQKGYLFAFFIGPHVGLLLQQFIFLRNLVSFRAKGVWRGVKDAFFLSSALGFYVLLIKLGIQFKFALLPTILAFPIVFSYRAMSDHYGLPRVKRKSERRQEVIEQSELMDADYTKNQATGWVVFTHPIVEWLWSHVNYHDVHHKYPYLSHIHLKATYAASNAKQEYRTVNGFGANLRDLWGKAYFS
jgi:fatty acid desaturase